MKSGKKGEKKAKRDATIKSMADANSVLWQSRLEIVEKSRFEHREHARELALENEVLQSQVVQTVKDTIDVVGYLKKKDEDKDTTIERLISQMQELQMEHSKEKEKIVAEFQSQIEKLDFKLATRTREVELIQAELKLVKDFRRKRAQMQRELEEIKETMFTASKEHKETLTELEEKFFEEKMKLQQEASIRISELAEKAHAEAIANLDETTKSVYKENIRINKALNYHMEEGELLRKGKDRMEKENIQMKGDKEIDDLLIQRKVAQARHNRRLVKELQERVSTLENSLAHVVGQFELEQQLLVEKTMVETESSRVEITKLQRMIELRTKEMNKVKKLARNILDQRTEIERFFLDSLEHVKKEIAADRIQYRKDAELAYQQKMLDAYMGKGEFPKIRTFNKADNSTNSVFHDLEAANHIMDFSEKVDISDLTWEQKEKVLRYLFAQMNKSTKSPVRPKQFSSPAAVLADPDPIPRLMDKEAWSDSDELNENSSPAFLTQTNVNDVSSTIAELPHIINSPLLTASTS